ncbi:MAG: type II toxin-antitoxin system RelE/ParE family toxin [Bacteroidetes bacterium]|nr:type II toxin-antitoxin system RelE/ParE family toxin [Bacteroidota bacterium]
MKVVWTPEAKETFSSNIDYLLSEWGEQVTLDFLDRVDEVVFRIKSNPNLFPIIKREDNVHRCVVVKQISLYYRIVSAQEIDLITFWNNYQNPERLKI